MRSKIAEKILSESTEEIKQKAQQYGNSLVDGWISFKDKYPIYGQYIWLKSGDLTERAIYKGEKGIELILPNHKFSSMMHNPTHWKPDTY